LTFTQFLTFSGRAQVFIPDQFERDWLNSVIPGIVDMNGMMDTLHPGIAQLDTALIVVAQGTGSLTLHSPGYLDGLVHLTVASSSSPGPWLPMEMSIVAVPEALRTLVVDIQSFTEPLEIHLPSLPVEMDHLRVSGISYSESLIHIDELPETVTLFEVTGVSDFEWSGECNAD